MRLFLPLVLPAVLGILTLAAAVRNAELRHRVFLISVLALPAGLAICSLLVFAAFLMHPASAKTTSLAGGVLLGLAVLVFFSSQTNFPEVFRKFPGSLSFIGKRIREFLQKDFDAPFLRRAALFTVSLTLFLLFLSYFVYYFPLHMQYNIHGGWDARYFYMVKAKFFTRFPEAWTAMFSSELYPTDYPLFLPAAIAWGWNALGAEALGWPPLISFSFALSLCFLILWFLFEEGFGWEAFCAGCLLLVTHGFQFWATALYADLPVTFFITASTLVFLLAHQRKERKYFRLAGLLAGFAMWTKNEGMLFSVWMGLLFAAAAVFDRDRTWKEKVGDGIAFGFGLIPGALAAAVVKMSFGAPTHFFKLKGTYGGETGEAYGLGAVLQQILKGDFTYPRATIPTYIAEKFTTADWNMIRPLFLIALGYALLFQRAYWFSNFRWILPAVILAVDLSYFILLQTMPPSLLAHTIRYALPRLTLHTTPLVIIFLFQTFGFLTTFRISPELKKGG